MCGGNDALDARAVTAALTHIVKEKALPSKDMGIRDENIEEAAVSIPEDVIEELQALREPPRKPPNSVARKSTQDGCSRDDRRSALPEETLVNTARCVFFSVVRHVLHDVRQHISCKQESFPLRCPQQLGVCTAPPWPERCPALQRMASVSASVAAEEGHLSPPRPADYVMDTHASQDVATFEEVDEEEHNEEPWITITKRANKRRQLQTHIAPKQQLPSTPSEPVSRQSRPKTRLPRMPPLPAEDYKIAIRPHGGLHLSKVNPRTLLVAVAQEAKISSEKPNIQLRVDENQNVLTISTSSENIATALGTITKITINAATYDITSYGIAPDNSCKGVVHGIGHETTAEDFLREVEAPGYEVLTCRRLGDSKAMMITFCGKWVPFFVNAYGQALRCYLYKRTIPHCRKCNMTGHREDVCPQPPGTPRCRGPGGHSPPSMKQGNGASRRSRSGNRSGSKRGNSSSQSGSSRQDSPGRRTEGTTQHLGQQNGPRKKGQSVSWAEQFPPLFPSPHLSHSLPQTSTQQQTPQPMTIDTQQHPHMAPPAARTDYCTREALNEMAVSLRKEFAAMMQVEMQKMKDCIMAELTAPLQQLIQQALQPAVQQIVTDVKQQIAAALGQLPIAPPALKRSSSPTREAQRTHSYIRPSRFLSPSQKTTLHTAAAAVPLPTPLHQDLPQSEMPSCTNEAPILDEHGQKP
ncbi:hypothetical protein HPB52_020727 [Rhipicephalus sanguineus]|uniref:CCHC-type domain-containing protein n=1 Tax=Rhipicephalus sanguineus TaxID=34632 RepID=A0A9D4Q8A6_RHISA|nr:hypothetical protein HPB52_020727 [Rhipicephalus sanguineus]